MLRDDGSLLARTGVLSSAAGNIPDWLDLPDPKSFRPKRKYRTIWISDIHLGTRGCKAEYLLDFLRSTESERLYLVGDICRQSPEPFGIGVANRGAFPAALDEIGALREAEPDDLLQPSEGLWRRSKGPSGPNPR